MPLIWRIPTFPTPKYLRDKYAIVGVGETTYTRGSGKTTRALGTLGTSKSPSPDARSETVRYRMGCCRIPAMTPRRSTFMAGDIGSRLNFYMDCMGGGSSTEALINIAVGVMEAGCLWPMRSRSSAP